MTATVTPIRTPLQLWLDEIRPAGEKYFLDLLEDGTILVDPAIPDTTLDLMSRMRIKVKLDYGDGTAA